MTSTKNNEECGICIEKYKNTINRKKVSCNYCNYDCCVGCAQTYLVSQAMDAHCMNCRTGWNREFIDLNMTKTFRTKEWREHKKVMIVNREKSFLPTMQRYAAAKKKMEEIRNIQIKRNNDLEKIVSKRRKLLEQINAIRNDIIFRSPLPEDEANNIKKLNEIVKEYNIIEDMYRIEEIYVSKNNRNYTIEHDIYNDTNSSTLVKEKKEFILKCVKEGCRGFLSTSYKCELCSTFVCKDCMIPKSEKDDDTHECKKDDVDTIRMIRKDTKPCPKCGIRISKVDGCFAKDTPILLWNGQTKMSQDIVVGDILIGDDGMSRIVEELCSGEDKLYEVTQNKADKYIVNSKHKLLLKYSGNNKIYWSNSENAWKMIWFDTTYYTIKNKKIEVNNNISKEEALKNIKTFKKSLNNTDIIEITIDDYMKLSDCKKKSLMGFKSNGINWEKKSIPLDPYIMGVWLGDGINDGVSFALSPETDPEIIAYILKWCENHNCELVHDDMYRFRVRKVSNNCNRFAIGYGASSNNCKACIKKKCSFCDLPDKSNKSNNREIINKKNPLKEIFDSYNLTRNKKFIPNDYLINDRETRLQLLAGIIDTDGHVSNNGKRIQIPQANHILAKQIELLSKSLGFITNINITKKLNIKFSNDSEPKNYKDHLTVNISGEKLHEIPTKVQRKKCISSNSNKDLLRTNINVKEIGYGKYYGWSISDNKRFILNDFTVVRNCDQMWCVAESCGTAFSWNTGKIVSDVIHNPHYYEWVRRNNNGVIPRNPADNPCNNRNVQYYELYRAMNANTYIKAKDQLKISGIHRLIVDVEQARLPSYPQTRNVNMFKELHCDFLLNKIDEASWKQSMFLKENSFEKKQQIGFILNTFVTIAKETMDKFYNELLIINAGDANPDTSKKTVALFNKYNTEFEQIRTYINDSLVDTGTTMMCAVPQIYLIGERWGWQPITKVEKILAERNKSKTSTT